MMCSMTVGAASGLESDEARCVGEFRTTLGLYWAFALGRCPMPAIQAKLAARVEMANTNAGTADPVVSERSIHALTI